jgi:hypothetical protein
MLAVGAVHLRYVSNPDDQEGAWRITRATRPRVLELVRCALEGPDGQPKSIDKTEVELVLAALLSCTIASVRPVKCPKLIPSHLPRTRHGTHY